MTVLNNLEGPPFKVSPFLSFNLAGPLLESAMQALNQSFEGVYRVFVTVLRNPCSKTRAS